MQEEQPRKQYADGVSRREQPYGRIEQLLHEPVVLPSRQIQYGTPLAGKQEEHVHGTQAFGIVAHAVRLVWPRDEHAPRKEGILRSVRFEVQVAPQAKAYLDTSGMTVEIRPIPVPGVLAEPQTGNASYPERTQV